MNDFGYDVTDYCDVDTRYGVLTDFDMLLSKAHARGLKVLLDFAPNHTSDRHPWFIGSRASRDDRKRDWYIWRNSSPDGGPPSNWISDFGGSAWEWDEATGQYYYHAFLKEPPDLNWRNPFVQAAMYDVMRFWLDRGVDGFRIDVLWHLVKASDFSDNPLILLISHRWAICTAWSRVIQPTSPRCAKSPLTCAPLPIVMAGMKGVNAC
jgi:alpha-glucosidase